MDIRGLTGLRLPSFAWVRTQVVQELEIYAGVRNVLFSCVKPPGSCWALPSIWLGLSGQVKPPGVLIPATDRLLNWRWLVLIAPVAISIFRFKEPEHSVFSREFFCTCVSDVVVIAQIKMTNFHWRSCWSCFFIFWTSLTLFPRILKIWVDLVITPTYVCA